MPLYQRHVELYRQRLRDERKPHAAAIYDSENQGDPTAAVSALGAAGPVVMVSEVSSRQRGPDGS